MKAVSLVALAAAAFGLASGASLAQDLIDAGLDASKADLDLDSGLLGAALDNAELTNAAAAADLPEQEAVKAAQDPDANSAEKASPGDDNAAPAGDSAPAANANSAEMPAQEAVKAKSKHSLTAVDDEADALLAELDKPQPEPVRSADAAAGVSGAALDRDSRSLSEKIAQVESEVRKDLLNMQKVLAQ